MNLESKKQRLSQKFLGKQGLHGLGLSRAENAVKVHLERAQSPEHMASQDALLEEIRREAAPYPLIVTFEDKASTSG
ncbi:MAG TPA: hypothetical protein VFR21_06725 [Bradyrhizobium sp.]|jgi:hypothetical protein|nr:hypothetical protein [Bradyrhizobium sp.]